MLSDSQHKLGAILGKLGELLPFSKDDACEELFNVLADFAAEALNNKEIRRTSKFEDMDLEALIQLRSQGGERQCYFFGLVHVFLL